MEKEDFIRLCLPNFVLEHFDAVSYSTTDETIDIYLDEKLIKPDGNYLSKGFTPSKTIQDFPLRGKTVLLHIRRRKWQNQDTGIITIQNYDLSHKGTDLTHDFVAFLKEAYR